jgi:hypothetical protein
MSVGQVSSGRTFDLTQIPHSKDPIRQIPKDVFENCSQAACNEYTPSLLEGKRRLAKTVTKEMLLRMYPKQEERILRGEELDWIYGLDYLERTFLSEDQYLKDPSKLLNLETVIQVNGMFSRMENEHPGQYRDKGIFWRKRDLNYTENIALDLFHTVILEQRPEGDEVLPILSVPTYQPEDLEVKLKISEVMDYLPKVVESPVLKTMRELTGERLTPQLVQEWAKDSDISDGTMFNVTAWLRKHVHYFPSPRVMKVSFENALRAAHDPNMHPIIKACVVWYGTVSEHISHHANKRTGKGIAGVILLAHGYPVPKIGPKDAKEYVDRMKYAFEHQDGIKVFICFIARMIIQTQQELKL